MRLRTTTVSGVWRFGATRVLLISDIEGRSWRIGAEHTPDAAPALAWLNDHRLYGLRFDRRADAHRALVALDALDPAPRLPRAKLIPAAAGGYRTSDGVWRIRRSGWTDGWLLEPAAAEPRYAAHLHGYEAKTLHIAAGLLGAHGAPLADEVDVSATGGC